jgi:putative N6-adenine-specific DNA methylase
MISKGLPGGYFRGAFGFQRWRDYDPGLFEKIRRERYLEAADSYTIMACDNSFPAIRAAQENMASAGMLGEIRIEKTAFEDWDTATNSGWLFINPPYGERMEEGDIPALYNAIGRRLKHRYSGHEAWILSGNPEALKHVGLRPGKRVELFNGPIRCRFHQYDLYEGSRKQLKANN